MTTIDLQIFSPRWGHDDTYSVELDRDYMEITKGGTTTRADWQANADPVWSGQSLQQIMQNDSIYPPEITQKLFQKVWTAWRDGQINDQQADAELQEVAAWINAGTRAKPSTAFWKAYF